MILPVNCEPLSTDCTLNPNAGETDAVTLPLAILFGANDKADSGISNKFLPEPLNAEPLFNSIFPNANKLPLIDTLPVN